MFDVRCVQSKSKLATYVIASGLTYGAGEDIFHYLFKACCADYYISSIRSLMSANYSSAICVNTAHCLLDNSHNTYFTFIVSVTCMY